MLPPRPAIASRASSRTTLATTGFIGAPTVTTLGEDVAAWNVVVQADNGNDTLVIQATGAAGTTIRWVATVRTAEVAW